MPSQYALATLLGSLQHVVVKRPPVTAYIVAVGATMHTTPTSSHSNYSLQDMDLSAPGPSRIQTRKRQREAEEDQVLEEFQPLAVSIPNVSCYLSLQQHGKIFS